MVAIKRNASWLGIAAASEWRIVDLELRELAKRRSGLDADEAQLLARAIRGEIWRRLGRASLREYLEEVLGYSPRQATERVRVATALEDLPDVADALARGELHWSAVRELTRVATKATERAWLDAARGKNLRQVEQAVAGRTRGDLPTDPPDPELVAQTIRFDVRPATLALLRQAQQVLEAERGERLDDDGLVAALCNAVLAGSPSSGDDSGRAKYQILVTRCDACGAGWQEGAGSQQPMDAADLARAECDAQRIGTDREPSRATQDVPPRVVRFVHRRDGGQCCVPGCRASRYLEIHHVIPREAGGDHAPENLTLLCDGHHRAHHEGKLAITGRAPKLTFRWTERVDSTPATSTVTGSPHASTPTQSPHVSTATRSPHVGTAPRDAELALTALGFRAHEARDAIAAALAELAPEPPLEVLLRRALIRLSPENQT
jgi:hypothetical protein